ncbi:ABC transporter ATP-binding protein [Methanolobus sp. ZRKC2]|uniref:ABC transporter ATP-binding protein n=1 Tax=Methanolobus sp. ZRKC2 TaxID=3125783 RepID=UPI003248FE27
MKQDNSWSLYGENKKDILSIVGLNFLSDIPRGMFSALLYLFILELVLPVFLNTPYDFSNLWQLYALYAAAFILYLLLSIWSQTNNYVRAYSISTDLRLTLGNKLRRLPLGFFKQKDPGDVTGRLLHDVNQAENTLSHNLPDIVTSVVVPLLLGLFLMYINTSLASIMFISVLIAAVFILVARKIIVLLGIEHVAAINETSSRILEYARSARILKAYDMTGSKFVTLDNAMLRLKKLSFKGEVYAGIPVQIALFILDVGYLAMLAMGAMMSVTGEVSIPELFTFAVLGYYFFAPVKKLGPILVLMRYTRLSIDRIGEVMTAKELPFDEKQDLASDNTIKFENVSFRYKDNDVLKDISCCFPVNSMTALVGLSGSGKSTMINLIARFWDVQDGTISIGGIPIKKINPGLLLSRISMVFQDVYLFNDTIANNIRVGKQNATDREIKEAARLARCDEFIEKLPNGYDTIVSEGGSSLSGGERQRISIARAIIKDAPIVLLDEATASLDPENESVIQEALENLVRGRTLIVIAHRFKSIENADQILVLDEGRISEQGTHDFLVNAGGLYQQLWMKQQKAGGWKMKNS